MIHVLPFDLATNAPLVGLLAGRIRDYTEKHGTAGSDALATMRSTMASLCAGDPNVLALAAVDDSGELLGHLVATFASNAVVIQQVKASGNVGDAMDKFAFHVEQWGRTKGATVAALVSHRDPEKSGPEKWRARGYVPTHTILAKPLTNGHGGTERA